jgi:CheY-like chemotaxis protein
MATILLVEDHEPIRLLLRLALEGEGYGIVEAMNGRQGLAVYKERSPDLVITDIIMPEMNGLDMILHLTRAYSAVKIIAISGEAINLVVANQFGACATVRKPFDIAKLLALVRQELAR